MNKKATALILTGMLLGSTATVFAAGLRKIEVYDNVNKVVVNKINKPFTKGEEPFTHNGRTYVPLRYVSDALGENVDWDGKTGTVYIGDRYSTEYGYLGKDIKHMSTNVNSSGGLRYEYNSENTMENNIGEEFSNYLYLNTKWTNGVYADFPLNGQYTKFTSNVAFWSGSKGSTLEGGVRILVDDKEVYKTSLKSSDMPKQISIDLRGVNKIRFEVLGSSSDYGVLFGDGKLTKK